MEISRTSQHAWARAVVPTIAADRRTTVLRGGATVVAYVAPGAPEDALHIAADEAVLRGGRLALVERIRGDIAAELVAVSESADLLVVGHGGRDSHARSLDAFTRALVHRAHCPVMLIPAGAAVSDCNELICGVDRSPGSAAALQWAARDAALRGVTVLAEQVRPWSAGFDDEPTQSLSGWVFAQNIAEPTTILCRLADGVAVAPVLVQTAAERQAVVVVGSHRSDAGDAHRCVSGRMAGQESVPVVVVPPEIPAPRTPPGT